MKTRGERLPSIRRTLTIFAMPVSPARILEDLSPFYRQEEFPSVKRGRKAARWRDAV